jgi:hypothetical protein
MMFLMTGHWYGDFKTFCCFCSFLNVVAVFKSCIILYDDITQEELILDDVKITLILWVTMLMYLIGT